MNRLRFAMVGGFLGAGKTTTLARLARFYEGQGQRVALVTNDQAADLVDTKSLRAQGLAVERAVRRAVEEACSVCKASPAFGKTQSFRPGRPTPTHRYATA
jgi:hypothetical protein